MAKARIKAVARIPINIHNMGNDYTGLILVGPEQHPMNVLLDTGSSALAVDGKKYRPVRGDKFTRLAQTDAYADNSSWTGAVIKTQISIGESGSPVVLQHGNVAITYKSSRNMFVGSDGILGLAYAPLDDAFTMPKNTWESKYSEVAVRSGKGGVIRPYLTQLAEEGVVSDRISFLTHRSYTHAGGGGAKDPLNNGWMIVGGGEESTDLYTGSFQTVKVMSDDWYSTTLKSVIVGKKDPIAARMHGTKSMSSNSIVDSGTNTLVLSPQMMEAVLSKLTPRQKELLTKSGLGSKPVSVESLKLADWPSLTFVLEGETREVSLKVAPSDYWQVNAYRIGAAWASITQGDPGFTILGLPLMNGYFTIFDGEAAKGRGVIKFAKKR